jgi:hypothetical protein
VRFPKTWINAATFPIYLDPTLDYQVGASGDDGFVAINTGGFFSDSALMNLDRNNANYWHSFARFAVTIPVGATITSAYISLKLYYCGGSPAVKVYAEKAANPAAPTTASDLAGRTRTTACLASWAVGYNDDAFHNSGDLASVLTELMGSYSYASDAAMLFIIENAHSTGANVAIARSYDYTGNVSGPKLHIEYTEAPTDPEGSLVAGKLIRGGLLLHGVLGRS